MTTQTERVSDERLASEDRLRLHAHDPDTFEFSHEDAECLVAEIDSLRSELLALRAAVAEVMEWVTNWSPDFTDDPEWPDTAAKVKSAMNGGSNV